MKPITSFIDYLTDKL